MSPETRDEILAYTRSGFFDKEELMLQFCEEGYQQGELDPEEVSALIDAGFDKVLSEQSSWPAITDCDRLDEAFEAITQRGIIALQNAGYTQSDGQEDCVGAWHDSPDKDAITGYCFYQQQDMVRAVRGEGLYLAFGALLYEEDEAAKGIEIGRIIQEELRRAGFSVIWDGTYANRLHIPKLSWQRRRLDDAASVE